MTDPAKDFLDQLAKDVEDAKAATRDNAGKDFLDKLAQEVKDAGGTPGK